MKSILSAVLTVSLLAGSAFAGAPKFPVGGAGGTASDLVSGMVRVHTTEIKTANLLAANASPMLIVPAPGVGKALVFVGAIVWLDYNSTAYEMASGEDLVISYTDASGSQLAEIETTGFLDQVQDTVRVVLPHAASSGSDSAYGGPLENAGFSLHMLNGEITVGDSPLKMKIYYRVVPTTW